MKRLFMALMCAISLYGAEINSELGYAPDYATAAELAKTSEKPLMVLAVATECEWCRKMESETLSDPEVRAFIDEKLVATILNKETDQSGFFKQHPTPQTPTLYFLNADDEMIFENLGYIGKESLLELLGDIVADYKEEEQ